MSYTLILLFFSSYTTFENEDLQIIFTNGRTVSVRIENLKNLSFILDLCPILEL